MFHSIDGAHTWFSTDNGWLTDTVICPSPPYEDYGELNYAASDRWLLPLRPPAADETDTAERGVTEGISLT